MIPMSVMAEEYGLMTINIYDSDNKLINDNGYKMFINGTRYKINTIYDRTDGIYNITFIDYFDQVVISNIYSYDRYINLQINTFQLCFINKGNSYANVCIIDRNGCSIWDIIGVEENITYNLEADDYFYDITYNSTSYKGIIILDKNMRYVIYDYVYVEMDKEICDKMASSISSLKMVKLGLCIFSIISVLILMIKYSKDDKKEGK